MFTIRSTMPLTCRRVGKLGAVLLALGVCAAQTGPRAFAQAAVTTLGEKSRLQMEAIIQARNARTPAQKKINSQLFFARQIALTGTAVAGAPKLHSAVAPEADGRYKVTITASVTPELLAFIKTQGGDLVDSFPEYRVVHALLPLASMETVAAREEVRFIGQFAPPMHNQRTGENASAASPDFAQQWATEALGILPQETDTAYNDPEGDATHAAKAARAQYGVSGAGIKVGVLSDSIDNGQGAFAAAQAAGYVPSNLTVLSGQGGTSSGEGEGLAMCEIVHRLAPGAAIYFATGDASEEQFATNINTMVADGCKIILDDIAYPDENPFQDSGPIAQAVDAASAKGVLYFSCAANFNNLDSNSGSSACWEGDYVSRNGSGTGYHAWDSAGDGLNEAQVQDQGYLDVALFWAEPSGNVTSQYDLVELDQYGDVYQVADDAVSSTEEAFQFMTYFPSSREVGVYLESGESRFLHVDLVAQHAWMTYSTSGRVRGHNCANAANAFCVAATPAATGTSDGDDGKPGPNGPYPNVFTSSDQVEPFSDDGPRRTFFANDGTPYTPGNYTHTGGKVLAKPDFMAADGVTTSLPSGGLNPFFGTSAATPHAGALAALLLSINASITPAEAGSALRSGCVEISNPGPGDRDAGKGILLAPKILAAAANFVAPDITSASAASVGQGKAFSYAITATGDPTGYNATGLPSGLSVNKTTGIISGTLASTATGVKTIHLSAANSHGTGTATLTLTIVSSVPVITSATTASATAGEAFSYVITAKNDPTSYNATGLPSGLSINKTTGTISGTPASTAVGTKVLHLSAINSAGTGTATLTLDIKK